MQTIAEGYDLLTRAMDRSPIEVSQIFDAWNCGPLNSYLLSLSARILQVPDPKTGMLLLDQISDVAENTGTGRWAAEAAFDMQIPIPSIVAAVDARLLSAHMTLRRWFRSTPALRVGGSRTIETISTSIIRDAIEACMICSYAQGLDLLRKASLVNGWFLQLQPIISAWSGGAIVRSRLLEGFLNPGYDANTVPIPGCLVARLSKVVPPLRAAIRLAHASAIPVPVMSATLVWIDSLCANRLPQHLVQAQRDAFGSHGFQRRNQLGGYAPESHRWA